MQSSEKGSEVWKILKNSIFTMIVDVSMATEYIKMNTMYLRMNFVIMSYCLYDESTSQTKQGIVLFQKI